MPLTFKEAWIMHFLRKGEKARTRKKRKRGILTKEAEKEELKAVKFYKLTCIL